MKNRSFNMVGKRVNLKLRFFFAFWLLFLFLFRLWYITQVPITGDEAYHWEWSRHLDWGYYDHPPMVGYFIYLFTRLGSSLFFVRFASVVVSLGLSIFVYLLTKVLFNDEEMGIISGILVSITPIFAVGAILITSDTPHAFFWIITLYFFSKAIFTQKSLWWYLMGISLGMAFLSKFFAIFLLIAIFLFLILSFQNRHWFFRKELYLSLLIAILVFLPNLIWNAFHNWDTFRFNLISRHHILKLSLKYLGGYLGGQALAISPFLFLIYLYGLGYSGYLGVKKMKTSYLFLFCTSAPIFFAFSLVGLGGRKIGLHWPAVGYLAGLITVSALFWQCLKQKKYLSAWIITYTTLILLTITIYLLPLNLEIIAPKLANNRDISEIYGWEELGQKVKKILDEMSLDKETFIFTQSSAFSSLLAFNTPKKPFVYLLKDTSVYGRSYHYWQKDNLLRGKNAILVCRKKGEEEKFLLFFERIKPEPPLKIYKKSRLVRVFFIYRCYNYKGLL
ncbi:MAG: glycosyltransferase family 39 protein [bacterium]